MSSDPAELSNFPRVLSTTSQEFDNRIDTELERAALEEGRAEVREQAAYSLANRRQRKALPTLRKVSLKDENAEVRQNVLWAVQKIGGEAAVSILKKALEDENPDTRQWASIFLTELQGKPIRVKDERQARFSKVAFDQTIPLRISGFAYVKLPNMGWVKTPFSPKVFENVYGAVMACPNVKTRESKLVIEKKLSKYHPDGSDHYEIYYFRGLTQRREDQASFEFVSLSPRTFYTSGKTEDSTMPALSDVIVPLNRTGTWFTDRKIQIQGDFAIRYVRGAFSGLAYVNPQRALARLGKSFDGIPLGPGESQLSSLHHPEASEYTNTLLSGTYKGKISDLDGDEMLDMNLIPCHATLDGELDRDLDGKPDVDPFDISAR